MTARFLAASLVTAAILGLSGTAPGQDKSSDAPASPAGKSDARDPGTSKDKPADAKDGDSAKDKDKDKPADSTEKKGEAAKPKLERATFGGGCFWCLEAVFERIPGVKTVVSGYAGGTVRNPSYELVCTGVTGHAEVVQMIFDPEKVSYDKLLNVFWSCHDPTTLNRQGPDFGTQYRSIILYHNNDQKEAALKSYRALTDAGVFESPIVTQLVPFKVFYPADKHHQDYYRRNKGAEYCQMQIVPKLMKLHLKP